MMTPTETRDALDELERLVDRHGLAQVLELLQVIAGLKAEHIRHTWQDEALAKVWDRAGRRIAAIGLTAP